jgi:16S rRNA (guanine(1405)-N(7))-methyltransferase
VNPVDEVVARLAASRKYKDVAPAALERVARECLAIERDVESAADRARRKLHQVRSSFVAEGELARAERLLAALPAALPSAPTAVPSSDELRAACRSILRCHASTRERGEPDEGLWRELFGGVSPRRVVDLGCGLHPFALPWMGLTKETRYVACDLDGRALALVQRFFEVAARAGALGSGETRLVDLLEEGAAAPLPRADVALALKLLPTLERQREGAAARLLERIDARRIVLSFPTASLGRRPKGMAESYAKLLERLLEGAPSVRLLSTVERPRAGETFHLLSRESEG